MGEKAVVNIRIFKPLHLTTEEVYVGGKLNGIRKGFRSDGSLFVENFFKNGIKHGVTKIFWSGRRIDYCRIIDTARQGISIKSARPE